MKITKPFTMKLHGETNDFILRVEHYANNNRMAVTLHDTQGEPWATISVNLVEQPEPPEDYFYIKYWSENKDVVHHLFTNNIIELTNGNAGNVIAKILVPVN